MTLEEAIKHAQEVAKSNCTECGKEHEQLAEWLGELMARRSRDRHGRWIECDYKHLEHGMIETEPKAGLCCSNCRTAFQKKKMTYKQYCAACGAKMTTRNFEGGAEAAEAWNMRAENNSESWECQGNIGG